MHDTFTENKRLHYLSAKSEVEGMSAPSSYLNPTKTCNLLKGVAERARFVKRVIFMKHPPCDRIHIRSDPVI